ncbi:hypothetical protein VHEMI03493 [[Torrubiella] hemipterigena]|uniref:Uncharacterized protein n=1 Tax=[Torrubiella] hemipterigena TaxID=1531966 RepID=A0A0A1SYN0_9HYPO|nr:hypothetical protein VHEMI03493 [[Torrubiella] hemipterigena]
MMMASSHLVTRGAQDMAGELSQSERYELSQYDKIVQFCNAIFAGEHPSIKLPADRTPIDAASIETALRNASKRAEENRFSASKQPTRANPIFLEKSEELICAEIQLERQRLERSLRDELEEQRATKHVPSEAWSSLDLSGILSKALAMTGADDAENGVPSGPKRANNDNASDSFDDNTFYSSNDDFVTSQPTPHSHNRNDKAKGNPSSNAANDARDSSPYSPVYNAPAQPVSVPTNPVQVPGLNAYNPGTANIQQWISSYLAMVQTSGQAINAGHAPNVASAYGATQGGNPYTGVPAEESTRGGHGSDRKKSKKKKRKADREAMNAAPSPRIKAEPRSVSPVAGPSQIRPSKRQRQMHDQGQDVGYDPSHSNLSGANVQGNYQRHNEPASRSTNATVVPQPRYLTETMPPRWVEHDGGYAGEPVEYSNAYGSRHASGAANVHQSSSETTQQAGYRDPRLGQGESLEVRHYPPRVAAEGYPAVHAQPTRIYVDGYGREYIEPQPQVIHQTAAPLTTEQGYNAILQRSMAGQQVDRQFDSGRAVYGGHTAPYAPQHSGGIVRGESQGGDNRFRGYSEHPMSQAQLVIQAAQQGSEMASNPALRATSAHPGAQGHDAGNIPPYLRTYGQIPGHPTGVDYNGRQAESVRDGYASHGVAYVEQPRDVGHQLPYSDASREPMYR